MIMNWGVVFAFLVGAVATGRAVRLFVDDDMPMFVWFREWWITHVPEKWQELVTCPFCMGIWLATANTAWAFISDLHWTWWFLNLMLAGAYLAAMINVRDVPSD